MTVVSREREKRKKFCEGAGNDVGLILPIPGFEKENIITLPSFLPLWYNQTLLTKYLYKLFLSLEGRE